MSLRSYSVKREVITFLFSALIANSTFADVSPVSLADAIRCKNCEGYAALSEGYRGKLQTIAFSGVANKLDSDKPEALEFTQIKYDDRGIGARCKPAFALMVGFPGGYRLPTIHIKDIPSIERLKAFKSIDDFKGVFGEFRGGADGWGDVDGAIHDSLYWSGFVLQQDGSIRVVSVFVYIARHGESASFKSAIFREGVFKPTGKTPQLEKR